jgi:hypothetical protein
VIAVGALRQTELGRRKLLMIVLDGRNDREKLDELLAAGEQTHLDYKAVLDLSQAKDKLKWSYGGFWSDLPLPALNFVRDHLSDGDDSA